jgi:hypothetical protein
VSGGATSTTRGGSWPARLDRGSLAGIALGVALIVQPWWAEGFRAGFFVTLAATALQVVASHLRQEGAA